MDKEYSGVINTEIDWAEGIKEAGLTVLRSLQEDRVTWEGGCFVGLIVAMVVLLVIGGVSLYNYSSELFLITITLLSAFLIIFFASWWMMDDEYDEYD